MVAEYRPLITCSIFLYCVSVCMLISYVLYATKCLNKINKSKIINNELQCKCTVVCGS